MDINEVSEKILGLAPEIISSITNAFNTNKVNQEQKVDYRSEAEDAVTDIDHRIGQIYINKIINEYPEISLDSEENDEKRDNGKDILIRIDPVDGTKHFVKGLFMVASTAALIIKGEVVFAMVINPFTKEVYHAYKGKGAFLNGRKISVSNKKIDEEMSFLMIEQPTSKLFKNDPNKFKLICDYLEKINAIAFRMRNIGISSLGLCYVAEGASPLFIDFSTSTKLYDVEAAGFIAKEAGAIITTLDKENIMDFDFDPGTDRKMLNVDIVVGNPEAVKQLFEII